MVTTAVGGVTAAGVPGTAAASWLGLGDKAGLPRQQEPCPYYERGFCKLHWAYQCQFIHRIEQGARIEICPNYVIGFCPKGPSCGLLHLKGGVIADSDTTLKVLANFPDKENWSDRNALQQQAPAMSIFAKQMQRVRCHNCGQVGHKSTYCQEDPLS